MLTESDRKWLEQKQLCEENAVTCYTFQNCSDCFAKETCNLWSNDYKDVAEFEARVAHKLLFIDTMHGCKAVFTSECPIADEGSCSLFCRLKHARLEVEEEMI